ncbi:MAG: YigZ family protein, partial [Clostridia bacterium]|nr:YigZ family protein [Clostridia bacterium]
GGAVVRASDDGEPSGTAGRPVTEVLQREELDSVACVVVRYFGGILLGAGGLIRAYAQGARLAVESAGKARMTRMRKLRVTLPYHLYGKASSKLSRMDLSPEEPAFSEAVSFFLTVPPAMIGNVGNELRDLSAGKALVEEAGEEWIPFPEE